MIIERLEIDITAQDIAIGVKGDCLDCPAAIAVWRAAKRSGMEVESVSVGCLYVRVWCARGGLKRFATPHSLDCFIAYFDINKKVNPGKHVLELVRDE